MLLVHSILADIHNQSFKRTHEKYQDKFTEDELSAMNYAQAGNSYCESGPVVLYQGLRADTSSRRLVSSLAKSCSKVICYDPHMKPM